MYYTGDTGADGKSLVLSRLLSAQVGDRPVRDILVVGCGSGRDAWALASYFKCRAIAIDLEDYFDHRYDEWVDFKQMDACSIALPDASFDIVYSFHALEHIPEYRKAVGEIARVLRPGATYCIGTPNRVRLAGYIGVPGYSLARKIRSNLRDWRQRLRGRFRNEYGAHAGYSGRELSAICSAIGPGLEISRSYYLALYMRHKIKLKAVINTGLDQFLWPSVYVLGYRSSLNAGIPSG